MQWFWITMFCWTALLFLISVKAWHSDIHIMSSTKDSSNLVAPKVKPMATKVNGEFVSPWPNPKGFTDIMGYVFTNHSKHKMKLKSVKNTCKLIKSVPVDKIKCESTAQPHVTWIGHATVCYQTEGVFFMTDPVFSERCSPSQWAGPKRFIAPPIEIEDLKIDVVLLSHTHYDHLDHASAQRIGDRALWIVPLGVKEILKDFGISNCVELDWWQSHTYKSTATGADIVVTFTPAKHWTNRGLFDRNTCLWGGYAVRSPKHSFFFAGDTAYCDVFPLIGSELGPFDLAAIPIGAYAPRFFMKDVHCDPQEAVQIHLDIRAKRSFGIHWGTFPMADEDFIEPALEVARTRELAGVKSQDFFTMRHGETLNEGEAAPNDFATTHPELFAEYLEFCKTRPAAE